MPIATRHRDDHVPPPPPLDGLVVRPETDARIMAALQERSEEEMARRFRDGHRAYVALLHGREAAWGWVASREAEIGEVHATFAIPPGELYLWNFVTLPAYRGMGIYPRLLDAMVRAESVEAERFWIACAPENHASWRGIRRAGFVAQAELSFDADGRPALRPLVSDAADAAARILGLPRTDAALAPCWRCVRAGRRGMTCAPEQCRCDYQRPADGCAA